MGVLGRFFPCGIDRLAGSDPSVAPKGCPRGGNDKPDDLFDSADGLEQAIEEALAGPNRDYVNAARYEIVDLVFTSPDEAWLLYDLDAQGIAYQSVGRATLDGGMWRISATLSAKTSLAPECAATHPHPPTQLHRQTTTPHLRPPRSTSNNSLPTASR